MVSRLVLRSFNDNASTEDQAALVRAMLAGNKRAWRDFHARYDRLILRCISRVTGRFARWMAEDEVREIYASLLVQLCAGDMAKLRSFDAERGIRLGSWIGVLATNCAVDHIRVLRREPGRESLDDMEEDDFLAAEPTPDELLDRKERLALAAEMLRDLPEKDRELFTLYFGEGLEPEQIAARMQISVNTVYSKKHKLQSRFEARFAEPRFSEALAA
ncbi:MAG: sigma-70 family RNA polymerase sigma factor [Minicystis sp.]